MVQSLDAEPNGFARVPWRYEILLLLLSIYILKLTKYSPLSERRGKMKSKPP